MAEPPGSKDTGWSDGEALTNVSFVKDVKLVSIEHPAIVNDVDKALSTLGGCKELSKTFCQTNKRIALRWRPQDIYCKSVYGERYPTTNLLMKVKRRWRKDKPEESQYKIQVLGVIDITYKFQAMVDYQYLPVVRQPDLSYTCVSDKLVLNKLCDRREFLDNGCPLFLPPSSFSRMDFPDKSYLLRKDIEHRPGYVNPDRNRPQNLIGTVRQKRTIFTQFCSFGDPVPVSVSEKVKTDLRSKYNNPEAEQKLRQLFEERPVWSRMALYPHFPKNKQKLKYLLPLTGFYYLSGPWRCLWCRFGFDPQKTPEAKMFQTVDFRKRQGSVGEKVGIKLKRKENLLKYQALRRNVASDTVINIRDIVMEEDESVAKPTSSETTDSEKLTKEEEQYIYTPTTIPPCRQMFYQLCDIRAPKIQHIIHRNDGKEKTCTEKDGWCEPMAIDKCRDLMSYYTMKILSNEEEQQVSMVDYIAQRKANLRKKKTRLARINKFGDDMVESDSEISSDDYQMEKEEVGPSGGDGEREEEAEEEDVNEMETELLDCV
ncbi:general transcription factor 3C polypeptide 5-like [Ylistrum balloti]|uniref:general transcription factor 3C polypeptide 5-like n=1 Tax=Ylistrum balloti TaxID=509963 RepID=UPI002905C3A1|nr:general transcription factor 3C polypeptide 5-like [Ylistrum balloti]